MAAHTALASLVAPPSSYDPALWSSIALRGAFKFETAQAKQEEDQLRARLLRKGASLTKGKRARELINLADRLEAANLSLTPLASLASARHMREVRRRLTGHTVKLVDDRQPEQTAAFTLLPGWRYPSDQLRNLDGRVLISRARSWLNAVGAAEEPGWIIAMIDGEFNCVTTEFDLHLHGLATDGKIDSIERLRTRPMFRNERSPNKARATPKIEIQPIAHNFAQVSYCFKSFWSYKGRPDGSRGPTRRIPEPYHSDALCWLDRHDISDVVLLVGCRASAGKII